MPEPFEEALRVCTAVRDLCGGAEGCGESFQRRVEDFPGLVSAAGLVPALTFYLSKVEDYGVLRDFYSLFSSGSLPRDARREKMLEDLREEGLGYASALAAILAYAARQAPAGCSLKLDGDAARGVAEFLDCIRRGGGELVVLATLEPFVVELGKLARALLGR